jgi:hypothetical protein
MNRVTPFDARRYYYYDTAVVGRNKVAAMGGTFSPNALAPVSWLRFDDYGLADDAAISTATDLSGNGNDWDQGTSGHRAVYKTNVVNGRGVARFDGSDDHLEGPDLSSLTAAEVFIVIKIDNDPPAAQAQTGLWDFSEAGDPNTHFPFNADSQIYDSFGTTVRKTVGDPTPSLASWRLYNVVSVSGEWTARLDGTQLFTTGTNTVTFIAAPQLGVSRTGEALDGDLAEFVLFDRELSSAERASIHAYFAERYGLTIA